MKSLALIVLSVFLANFSATLAESNKLQVSIFYESECPDSKLFISRIFRDSYNGFKDFIDVQFVPFGKARSVDTKELFSCQHGPKECEGNMIQSCALNQTQNSQTQVEFAICQMEFRIKDRTGKSCCDKVGINFEEVQECKTSGLGVKLQLEAERLTNEVQHPIQYVPTVVYNGKFVKTLQKRSMRNFPKVVCKLIKNAAPACKKFVKHN